MTELPLPAAGTFVELTAADDAPLSGVRVVASGADVITLSIALASVPPVGATVTLRWPAGARGRYAVDATVQAVDENRVELIPAGTLSVEQNRNFVRGGGGENVLLCRPGQPDTLGWIRDISEQGIRAHFADVELAVGDEMRLRVELGHDLIEVAAVAATVDSLRQTVPARGPMSVEVVAVLAADEGAGRVIRRYILRQQMLARTRSG